jgi:hypothetical protein
VLDLKDVEKMTNKIVNWERERERESGGLVESTEDIMST